MESTGEHDKISGLIKDAELVRGNEEGQVSAGFDGLRPRSGEAV
jgi:hypothetical protein